MSLAIMPAPRPLVYDPDVFLCCSPSCTTRRHPPSFLQLLRTLPQRAVRALPFIPDASVARSDNDVLASAGDPPSPPPPIPPPR